MPHLCVLYPGIQFTIEGKVTEKNFSQGSRRVPAGYDSIGLHSQLLTSSLNKAVTPSLPSNALGKLGEAMFSIGIYLPSCQDKNEDGTHGLS